MATASTRGKHSRPVQPVSLLLWQDALVEWGIPVVLIGALIVVALLGAFDEISRTTGVLTLGCVLILLVAFLLFKPILTSAAEARLRSLTWGFALVWLLIVSAQLYSAIFIGEEVTSGAVAVDSGGMDLTLGPQGTIYDLVVEGSFVNAAGEGGREGGYTLRLEKDGQVIQELPGRFSETLSRQRLGRRGSTTTRQLHNHVLHPLTSPGEGTYHLAVIRTDQQLSPTLQIALFRDASHEYVFWALSLLLLIGAYVGELWHATLEPPLVLVTAATLAFVITFRHLGVPPHSYQDLVGAVMVAAIAGPVFGWIFRILADLIAKSMGVKPSVVASGKGKPNKGK